MPIIESAGAATRRLRTRATPTLLAVLLAVGLSVAVGASWAEQRREQGRALHENFEQRAGLVSAGLAGYVDGSRAGASLKRYLSGVRELQGARTLVVDRTARRVVQGGGPERALSQVLGRDLGTRVLAARSPATLSEAGRVVSVAPVVGAPWSIVAIAPEDELLAPLGSLRTAVLILLLLTAAAAAIVMLAARGGREPAAGPDSDAASTWHLLGKRICEATRSRDSEDSPSSATPALERAVQTLDEPRRQARHEAIHHCRPDESPCPAAGCPEPDGRQDGSVGRSADAAFIPRAGAEPPGAHLPAPLTKAGAGEPTVGFHDTTRFPEQETSVPGELENVQILQDIRDALDEDRFVLYAQPIIDLCTGETVQHELLIRMIDRGGQIVSPAAFLPVAEQHGLIREIDQWVIREAVGFIRRGHPIEVNLSALSFADAETFYVLQRELRETGADPALLVIEITETAVLERSEVAAQITKDFRELGCRVALDDFGTGYAGFGNLKCLPLDYLKIDIEFIRDLVAAEASQHVVRAIVDLARSFGHRTVAEGVEDQATLDALRTYGVNHAQGYFIGRPLPAADVLVGDEVQ